MSTSVAILGATGIVGQKTIALLSRNSNFEIIELVASEYRIGQTFSDACDWREPLISMPKSVGLMKLVSTENLQAKFIVSCLPPEVAKSLEPKLAQQGKMVFSNASAFRMHPDIPLLIPEINYSHLELIRKQPTAGKIITNPNCAAVGIALALAPLVKLSTIEHVSAVTLQSASGAGYPGVASLDVLSNTIPHIAGEADKITEETKRILGSAKVPANFALTAHVHRVPVAYGHVVTLHITFRNDVHTSQVTQAYQSWNKNSSNSLFVFHDKDNRPQATRDLSHDDMRVHIGQVRQGDKANVIGLICLTHNLVRGAAGAVIANMESYLRWSKRVPEIKFSALTKAHETVDHP
jgi:aspartate-semialdehyde dehydrogenase